MRSLLLHGLLLVGLPVFGQFRPQTITTFTLHAWYPELGAAHAASAAEVELSVAAREALARRLTSAAARLDGTTATSPRDRVLLVLFRHMVESLRFTYTNGARVMTEEGRLDGLTDRAILLSSRVKQAAQGLDFDAMSDATTAAMYATQLPAMLFDVPDNRRRLAAVEGGVDAKGMIESGQGLIAGSRAMFDGLQTMTRQQSVLKPEDINAIDNLATAADSRARRDTDLAARALQSALTASNGAATIELLLDLGDAYAFPQGDPLTLGLDPAAVRLAASTGNALQSITAPPSSDELAAAERWYARVDSAADSDEALLRRLNIRRGSIAILRGDVDTALLLYQRAASTGDDIATWSALATIGILRRESGSFARAVEGASAQRDEGAVMSFRELLRLEATKALQRGEVEAAVTLLEIASDTLVDHGFGRAAVETLADLAKIFSEIGRTDAEVVASKRARGLQQQFLERVRIADQRYRASHSVPLGFDPAGLLAERAVFGSITLDIGGALFLKSLIEDRPTDEADVLIREAADDMFAMFSESEAKPIRAAMRRTILAQSISAAARQQLADPDLPCDAVRVALLPLRERARNAGADELLLRIDVSAAACTAKWLAEDRAEIERIPDLLAPIRSALVEIAPGRVTAVPQSQLANEISMLFARLDVLLSASGFGAVDRVAQELREMAAKSPRLAGVALQAELYGAIAETQRGNHPLAMATIERVRASDAWAFLPQALRVSVLGAVIESESQLCVCGAPECDPMRGLLAFERLYRERQDWAALRSGVVNGNRMSAERAMHEARLSRGDVLSPEELQRLRELREQSRVFGSARPVTLEQIDDVIASLPPRTTALVFFLGRRSLVLAQLHRGIVELTASPVPERTVEVQLHRFQQAVQDRTDEWHAEAATTASLLLGGARIIASGDEIVIVATDTISRIAFDVLPIGGRKLVDAHPIIFTDHLGSVANRWACGGAMFECPLVVGIDGNGLRNAELEARNVAAMLHTVPLTTNATAAKLTDALRTATSVHLAVHAYLSSESPFESYLDIGGAPLPAWQLFRDAPAAHLITLSACDTAAVARAPVGLGALAGEATSLVSAAFAGGAQYVLASMWVADGATSANMMDRFYASLADRQTASRALQSAKLWLWQNDVTNPFANASFALTAKSLADVCE